MVSVDYDNGDIRLTLRPNRSLSWRGNQYLFLCIAAWLGSISVGLAAMGAWIILPFLGLELLALGVALYYVSWKLSHCEVLHIARDQVTIAKGKNHAKQAKASWILPRADLTVHIEDATHPWGTPTIQFVCKTPANVRVGEFLNQQDCQRLLQQLMSARLKTRRSQGSVDLPF